MFGAAMRGAIVAILSILKAHISSHVGMRQGASPLGACVHTCKPAMLEVRCSYVSHPMDGDMNRKSQSQIIVPDAALNALLERIGGALTVSRQVTLPSGKLDAVIVAATLEAAELFGFSQCQELTGKLLSEVHASQCALQMRFYSWARLAGEPDAPNSYPSLIHRSDGQLLWVQKEVEQQIEPEGSIWITRNELLPQDRNYAMPQLQRLDEIIHECVVGNLINPFWEQPNSPRLQEPAQPTQLSSEDTTMRVDVNNKLLSKITNSTQPGHALLPFEEFHTVALPLRHADRTIWIHECKVEECGRQWWSYTERPQHCPQCGSRLWRGSSKWERRRVVKGAKAEPNEEGNLDEAV